jgi:hypothetical protein
LVGLARAEIPFVSTGSRFSRCRLASERDDPVFPGVNPALDLIAQLSNCSVHVRMNSTKPSRAAPNRPTVKRSRDDPLVILSDHLRVEPGPWVVALQSGLELVKELPRDLDVLLRHRPRNISRQDREKNPPAGNTHLTSIEPGWALTAGTKIHIKPEWRRCYRKQGTAVVGVIRALSPDGRVAYLDLDDVAASFVLVEHLECVRDSTPGDMSASSG